MSNDHPSAFPSRALRDLLLKLVEERRGESILVLSDDDGLKRQFAQAGGGELTTGDCSYNAGDGSEPRFALGIIACRYDNLNGDKLDRLASKMRDTRCERVYLCRAETADAKTQSDDDTRIRALGFRRLPLKDETSSGQPRDTDEERLYYFDIFDYKDVPDWLNSRFWSNPDMWDKSRW